MVEPATYHLDVGDEYTRQFEARDDRWAEIECRHEANITGCKVDLYRGPIRSGVRPFYTARVR